MLILRERAAVLDGTLGSCVQCAAYDIGIAGLGCVQEHYDDMPNLGTNGIESTRLSLNLRVEICKIYFTRLCLSDAGYSIHCGSHQ